VDRKSVKSQKYTIDYRPNKFQIGAESAVDGGAKVVLALGGIRAGKSVWGVEELLRQFYVKRKKPKLGWIVSPTFTMSQAPEDIFKRFVYSDSGTLVLQHKVGERSYLLRPTADAPNTPIRIEFKTANEPDRLRGASVGVIVLDEGAMMSEEAFNICLGRVMDNDGLIIIPTTPRGKNWIWHRVYQKSLTDPLYACIRGRSDENPYISKAFIDRKRDEFSSPSLIRQELEGEFTSFEGAVFNNFDPGTHVINAPELRDGIPVYCGIDWGFNDPFVCVWLACVDGVWVVLDEYYRPQTMLADHVSYLKNHPLAHRVRRYWCDPSALQERREFQRMGIKTMPARRPDGNRSVSWPVMRARLINTLFGQRLQSPWDPKRQIPGLVYSDTCPNGIKETQSLAYVRYTEALREEKTGNIISYRVTDKEGSELDRNATEEIEDRLNHFVDSLGYCIFSEARWQGAHPHYTSPDGKPVISTRETDPAIRAQMAMERAIRSAERLDNKPKI
jgi:terminase large subunit-like protein